MQGTGRAGLRDEAKTGRLSRRLTLYTTHSAGLSSSFFPSGTVVISVGIQALWKCVHPLDREGEDPADPIPFTGSRGPPAEYLSSKPGSQAIMQPFPHLLLVPSRILMYVQLLFLTHTQRKKK